MSEFLLKSDIDEITQQPAVSARNFAGKTVMLAGWRALS